MTTTFDKYTRIFSVGLQNTVVYRWNFLLRALFGIVPLIGTVYLWRALFASEHQSIGGYQFSSMVYYFLLVLLASNLITPTEDEWQIASDIREGQLNSLLTKPLDYLAYRVCLFLGYRVIYTLVTLPPVLLIFAVYRDYVTLPVHLATWGWTAISLTLAAALQFLIAYSVAMLAFWILEISTLVFILFSFEYFLSGQVVPLDIMPAWFQEILKWLPFTYELFFPVNIFQEKVHGALLMQGLAIQTGWVLVTFALARLMWKRGLRHYQAVGG